MALTKTNTQARPMLPPALPGVPGAGRALVVPPGAPGRGPGGEVELRAIRPPVVIPMGWLWLAWVGLGLVLAWLAWRGWVYWRRRRAERPAVPAKPPHVLARERLTDAMQLLDQPEPFCVAVSTVLRDYLEGRFELHAPDRTTEEFLDELGLSSVLEPVQKESLARFLQRCDLVKFAKDLPSRSELMELHGLALRLVDETVPRPAAAGDGQGLQAGDPPRVAGGGGA